MIQIKVNISTLLEASGQFLQRDVPEGMVVYCDQISSVLVPSEEKDSWIAFGLYDNLITVIDDDINPVEGVLIPNSVFHITLG